MLPYWITPSQNLLDDCECEPTKENHYNLYLPNTPMYLTYFANIETPTGNTVLKYKQTPANQKEEKYVQVISKNQNNRHELFDGTQGF